MEECESLDSEMTELQEFESQDDEDEVEELQNSLRELVQDQTVKPKIQCLMVDPSFSMVTVQSEDSGIVWETASSRCSTPWASETSSISEGFSMEGSGAAGKVTIVFDEEKVVRRKTRSGGRSSRLGDRLSRPGSSRSASALGVERPEMAEASLPNVKQEKVETEPDLEEIRSKDQQLFSLISEGYEILNIRVPSKLPTVDEEESTELQDNLSYLDQTPKIRSRNHHNWIQQHRQVLPEEEAHKEDLNQDLSHLSADTELGNTPSQKESTSHIDYFEKFTLLDEAVPGEKAPELQEEAERPAVKPEAEEQKHAEDTAGDSPSALEESFVFVTDVDIVAEHLDEFFYGEGAPDILQQKDNDEKESRLRMRRESQRSMKESGSVLFESEETILTPIYISPGPPKIIDPILLEEPTAMSFMYSDLYEDSVGDRRKSDEEHSEAESVASEKSYKRRLSDSEEADGYLEKFILKDETPTVEVQPETAEDKIEGRMMWSQSTFEMTGCLTRAVKEETEEPKTEDVSGEDRSDEQKTDSDTETKIESEETKFFTATEKQAVKEAFNIPVQVSKLKGDLTEREELKYEVKGDQTDLPQSSIYETLPEAEKKVQSGKHPREEKGIIEVQPCQTQKVIKTTEDVLERSAATVIKAKIEEPMLSKSKIQTETTKEAAADTKKVAAEKVAAEGTVEPETVGQKMLTLTEPSSETETSTEILLSEAKEEVVPEDVASVEVVTDCDSAVHAVVKVSEKEVSDTEIQTQVQIDLKEAAGPETTHVHKGEKEEALQEEPTGVGKLPEPIAAIHQASEPKTEISSELTKPVSPKLETDSNKKTYEITESQTHQQDESAPESDKTKLISEVRAKTPTDDPGAAVQETRDIGDDLILLVPKGQAIEMDVNICQWSDKTRSVVVALPEPDSKPEHTLAYPQNLWARMEETKTEPLFKIEPEVAIKQEVLRNDLDIEYSLPAAEMEADLEEDESMFSPLRSFTPQEDLSGLQTGAEEAEQKMDVTEANISKDYLSPDINLHREDVGQKMELDELVVEAPEVPADEIEYEVISKQDAKELLESKIQRGMEKSSQDREERMEVEMEERGELLELSPEEELIEADYEIIDAEEESQARLAAELQGMDWFCLTCGCLMMDDNRVSGEHRSHEVKAVDAAYEEIKEKMSDWISVLQERSENIEDLVSELELAYNSVEDQCVETEAAMQAQNEKMMALVMEQYNNMSISMEEEKKAKLEQLYDQIVSFQESIDSAKATLETTAREAETDARSPEDIYARLKAALEAAMSLELGPKGLLVFEDYAKGNASSSHLAQRKGIPVPQSPTLQPQEPGSATSTSVTVYWEVNPGDIIDCFQVYCMEDPQGAVSEEYRVTVKESYCALEELEPDKQYKVWVMAVNYTGCSLPSERLTFRTAPSVPVIDTERCTVTWDSATLRWSSAKQNPGQSFTLEYCRQYELEGEGLRSISAINSCEQRVLLQPNENYLFYIKAVNEAGASEQSEAALISTKGTRFHLLKDSAHPALELSVDETTLHYSQDTYENMSLIEKQCPSILGELLPGRGRYYWETIVSGSTAYRIGVAYSTVDRNSPLGENRLSWCLHCIPTPSGCRYQLLHNDIQSSVFVIEMPERVGTLLDYQHGRLSFYNAQSGQLLNTFSQSFTQPCHPALALELPGSLEVSTVPEVPEFTKDS